jgi:hypothetical protein
VLLPFDFSLVNEYIGRVITVLCGVSWRVYSFSLSMSAWMELSRVVTEVTNSTYA